TSIEQATSRCTQKSNFQITIKTRTKCSSCRLRKCFELSMKPHLIRAFNLHQQTIYNNASQAIAINQQQISMLPFQPTDLHSNNHSRFAGESWDFLSNILCISMMNTLI
ncbi:unnamed protein product, partial [Rotaria magnacalcarata]